jgi:hypothetical protein
MDSQRKTGLKRRPVSLVTLSRQKNEMKEKLVRFLKTPIVYLCVFLGFKAFQTLEAYRPGTHHLSYPIIFPIELVFSAAAAIFVFRGNRIAKWVLGIYMLTYCLGVPFGILLPFHQYVLKPVAIVFGIYFPYAGFQMIREARKSGQDMENPSLQADIPRH